MSLNNTGLYLPDKHIPKELSLWFCIKSGLTFKYLSNLSIILSILAYYMNAFDIFFILMPLVIVNFLVIAIAQIFNFNELMLGLLEKELPNEQDRDKAIPKFALLTFLWHFIPVLWIYYILEKDDIVKIFHPNYIETFCKSIILPIIYYYFLLDSKVYGNLNYINYLILYIILLLAACNYLYN
jgi:hypothetical protein